MTEHQALNLNFLLCVHFKFMQDWCPSCVQTHRRPILISNLLAAVGAGEGYLSVL